MRLMVSLCLREGVELEESSSITCFEARCGPSRVWVIVKSTRSGSGEEALSTE